ncbi:MAG TPA: hypothetical protein VE954_13720 [Oligoflexus sp.]|uniref:hypothetical protein n=1 Tax=Oligoflexus sp. TaxID=1971216 RepID=UPI002D2FF8ED|nr:hypothetical protein [Oligoflexus sp.]HYX34158.1 hypothetical protein [Oligoflexus sp.]
MDRKNSKSTIDKDQQTAEDEATIFAETAHMRDRDEMVLDGNRIVQGGASTDIDDEWDPADGDRLTGGSEQSSEAVDSQLNHMGRITQDIRESRDHRAPTLAKPMDDDDHFEDLSDEDLMKYADVLGIPDRQSVPRMALIGKIREQTRAGL